MTTTCSPVRISRQSGADIPVCRRNAGQDGRQECLPHLVICLPHLFILAVVVLGLSGCHAVDFYHEPLQCPVSPALEPPRERSMVSLPTYRVEPPDILQIEMLKLVPLPPYRIDIYDVLQIRVLGTILDQPIDGFYLVEGEGIVSLGPAYGTVRRGGHDDRRGHRGHHPQVAGGVGQAGRLGAVGPHGRHAADHRPVPDRAGRHDQPAAIRPVARGGQDGDGDPRSTCKSTCRSISTRRRRRST